MTGRRNRAQAPKQTLACGILPCKPKSGTFSLREKSGSSPRAPADLSRRESRYLARLRGKYFLRLAFYMDYKNGIERIFSFSKQPWNSVRTSLVPLSICLWEVLACGDSSPKFKVFAVSFRFCAEFTKRSIFGAVGGLRYRILQSETASEWSLSFSLC